MRGFALGFWRWLEILRDCLALWSWKFPRDFFFISSMDFSIFLIRSVLPEVWALGFLLCIKLSATVAALTRTKCSPFLHRMAVQVNVKPQIHHFSKTRTGYSVLFFHSFLQPQPWAFLTSPFTESNKGCCFSSKGASMNHNPYNTITSL